MELELELELELQESYLRREHSSTPAQLIRNNVSFKSYYISHPDRAIYFGCWSNTPTLTNPHINYK